MASERCIRRLERWIVFCASLALARAFSWWLSVRFTPGGMREGLLIGGMVATGLGLFGCGPVASPDERRVRDAVETHFDQSGLRLPIVDRILIHRESAEELGATIELCRRSDDFSPSDALVDGYVRAPSRGGVWTLRLPFSSARRSGADYQDYLEVGRPHVDRATGQALIYVQRNCPLCGFGRFLFLERDGATWRVVGECEIWVS